MMTKRIQNKAQMWLYFRPALSIRRLNDNIKLSNDLWYVLAQILPLERELTDFMESLKHYD